MEKAISIDAFIAQFPPAVQKKMQQVRKTILEAAPKAEECINYGIPTFKYHGNLVHFSAYEKHIGFYPGATGIEKFQKEIAGYKSAKGSVQFSLDESIPYDLIRKITLFRVKQNEQKMTTKSKRPPGSKK